MPWLATGLPPHLSSFRSYLILYPLSQTWPAPQTGYTPLITSTQGQQAPHLRGTRLPGENLSHCSVRAVGNILPPPWVHPPRFVLMTSACAAQLCVSSELDEHSLDS